MYSFKISENLQKVLKKLSKKNKQLHEQVMDKIDEILNCFDIEHYKNLRYHKNPKGFLGCRKQFSVFQHNMKDSKRAHIGHFVLVFQFDKFSNEINFDDFDHHDKIYRR